MGRNPEGITPSPAHPLTPHGTLRMCLAGANPKTIWGEAMLPGKTNYLIGRDRKQWHTDVGNYQRVRYTEVYPGVDLVYYGDQRQLEYDFVVAPRADPARIALKFDGAKSLTVDRTGDLIVGLAGGSVKWHKPVVYQQRDGARKAVVGRYSLKGRNQVAFALGRYDNRRPLVIDPVFAYSSYLGGSGEDIATGIALDNDGNAYVCGWTLSDDLLGTSDPPGGRDTPDLWRSWTLRVRGSSTAPTSASRTPTRLRWTHSAGLT